MTPIICEKGKKGHPLTDEQKEHNSQKSKVRSPVGHVFGFMEQTMGGGGVPGSGNGEGQSQHCTDKPCLQHVQTCAD